jgi:Large polyvalent protein-associated domain 7
MATEPKISAASSGARNVEIEDVSADPFADVESHAEPSAVNDTDAERARAIEVGVEQLMNREKLLHQPEAAELVKADLWIMERITDPQQRYFAATAMAEAGRSHETYRTELLSQSPKVSAEVDAAAAEDARRSAVKDARKDQDAAAFKEERSARAAAWTDEEAKLQAAQDLAALQDKKISDPFDVDYHQADMAVNANANAVYQAELQRLQPEKVNTLEPSIEKEQQHLAGEDAERRSAWLSKAKASPEVAPANAGNQNHLDSDEIFTASQSEIRPIVPEDVAQKYKQVGDKFYSRPAGTDLVFEDKGNRLETKSNDEQVAESLVRIAEARGWDEIKVAGTETFRKEVWLEAAARGMHIKGYTPSEQDKAELAKKTQSATAESEVADKKAPTFRGREILAEPATPAADSRSQAMSRSYAADSPEDAVRKHPELVGAVAATAAIEKRGQADGLTPEQQKILQARVRQNVMNSIEAGNIPKQIEIREDVEKHVEAENHREVSR